MVVEKNLNFYKKLCLHIEQKMVIEAICTNNIHTDENVFRSCHFLRFVSCFFQVVYYGLYESSLDFQSREDKMHTFYEKKIYFLNVDSQFDVPKCKFIMKDGSSIVLSHIFAADTKITFGNNFLAPLIS